MFLFVIKKLLEYFDISSIKIIIYKLKVLNSNQKFHIHFIMESAIAKEFLYNTYKFSTISRILQMDHTPPLWRIKLQNTVFHPQGGGQPNDIGSI